MKTLLTGATGLLGPYLADALREAAHETVCVGLSAPVDPLLVRCDLTDRIATEALFHAVEPGLVIHAAALTNVDLCERDPALADRVNRGTTETLAELAGAAGARIVLISTDSVFDGARGGYTEQDAPHPLNAYARSKLAAESALSAARDSLAVRTNFFGRSSRSHGLAEWLIRELGAGHEIVGFADVVFSALHCAAVADLTTELAATDTQGVVHLGAADSVSKLEFAQLVADAFGFDSALITPGNLADVALQAPRPRDTSLVSARAEQILGRRLPSVAHGVAALAS